VSLIFSPESGEAIVGSERVSLVPVGDDGSVRIFDHSGSVIRPLRFGERTRLLIDALRSDDPPAFCSDLLVFAATNAPVDVLTPAEKVLALLLAGGNIDAPSLSRTIAVVAGSTGWSQDIINAKTAIEIDRIAYDLTSRSSDWKKIVFPRQGEDDVDAMISELITGLLRRVDEQTVQSAAEDLFPIPESNPRDMGKLSTKSNLLLVQKEFSPITDYRRETDAQPAKHLAPSIAPPRGFKSYNFSKSENTPGRDGLTSFVLKTSGQQGDGQQKNDISAEDRRSGKREWKEKENPQTRSDYVSSLTNSSQPNEKMKDLIQRLNLFPHPPAKRTSPGIFAPKPGNEPAHEKAKTGGFDGKSASSLRNRKPVWEKGSGIFPKAIKSEAESWTDIPPVSPAYGNRIDPGYDDSHVATGAKQKSPLPGNAVWPGSNAGQRIERPSQPGATKPQNGKDLISPVSYTILPAEETNQKQKKDIVASGFNSPDPVDLADEIGRLLSAEADLRGID
jgi:hypothetical protein